MLRSSLAASTIMSSTSAQARSGNGIGNANTSSTKVRLAVPTGADFSSPRRSPQYLSRLTDVTQMDMQSALDQMRSLLSGRPQLVYKTAYYRKQTKNHWARDDPAFGVLQAAFLTISSVAYAIAFRTTVMSGLAFLLYSLLWNWLVPGVILATLGRELANRHMVTTQSSSHVKQSVEWLYAFDIHCNAFFPLFCLLCEFLLLLFLLYAWSICSRVRVCAPPFRPFSTHTMTCCILMPTDVAQFFLLPLVLGQTLFALLLSNTLYAAAFSWYWYITHLGYRSLPFLSNTEIFLFPIAAIVMVYILNIIGYPFSMGWNASRLLAQVYFYWNTKSDDVLVTQVRCRSSRRVRTRYA